MLSRNRHIVKTALLVSALFLLIPGVDIVCCAVGAELDGFGGWQDIRGDSTGFFHIETINDRSLLVTPDGHGFVALGVNHLGAIRNNREGARDLFRDRYQRDWSSFAADVLKQYELWGFNTVDDAVEALRKERPFFAAITLVRTAKYYSGPDGANPYEFPDVFSASVRADLENRVTGFCAKHRDNPRLIAYYWTDTPTWDIHKTRRFRGTDWVSEIRAMPADSAGRKRYAQFLTKNYDGDIGHFCRAYDQTISSFDELRWADFSNLDLTRYEVERDDQEFLGLIADTYYGIVGPSMRRADPNHMVFGEKYLLGDIPQQVLKAAIPHIDAVAIQPGDGYVPIYTPGDVYPAKEIERLYLDSGKPIMICDHQISFPTALYPQSIWPFHQRETEEEAATATADFLQSAFRDSYVIGYMRCQYIDRYSERRRASKLGLLQEDGTPHQHLIDATIRANARVKEIVRDSALRGRP